MKKYISFLMAMVVALFGGLITSKADHFSVDISCGDPVVNQTIKSIDCDIVMGSDGYDFPDGKLTTFKIQYMNEGVNRKILLAESEGDIGYVNGFPSSTTSDGGDQKEAVISYVINPNTHLESGATYTLATITLQGPVDQDLSAILDFFQNDLTKNGIYFNHNLYAFGVFDEDILKYYDDYKYYDVTLSFLENPQEQSSATFGDNYPVLRGGKRNDCFA